MEQIDEREKRMYLPRLDREGNSIGDQNYMVPSPPERDKPSLTQADIDKYYQENHMTKVGITFFLFDLIFLLRKKVGSDGATRGA